MRAFWKQFSSSKAEEQEQDQEQHQQQEEAPKKNGGMANVLVRALLANFTPFETSEGLTTFPEVPPD